MRKLTYLFLLPILFLTACSDDQAEIDDAIIDTFLTDNNIDAEKTDSGLYYKIDQTGDGESPTVFDMVVVRYTGSFLDGTVFETTGNDTQTFELGGLIAGWREGIQLLERGGSGTFYIPSALAYGTRGAGSSIPPNTVLIFDIELVNFF